MASSFRILHCFRAPLGGLFRHVRDLVIEQSHLGQHVAVVCDAQQGDETAERLLRELHENCAMGVWRVPMSRGLGLRDIRAAQYVHQLATRRLGANVLHGHGAKGGAYARLAARRMKRANLDVKAVYTPHGGSLHYDEKSLGGRLYLTLERKLEPLTDGLIFESQFSARTFAQKIGTPNCAAAVIPNGLHAEEFTELHLDDLAADFLFIGELRRLKGVDIFLKALAAVRKKAPVRGLIVGSGPDEEAFKQLAKQLQLEKDVIFSQPTAARRAFVRGRCLVVPSRAESFPYIVLEGAAASLPMIATNVGGIPEITEGTDMPLIPAEDVRALATQMAEFLVTPSIFIERAKRLAAVVSERYTVEKMAHSVLNFYDVLFAGADAFGKRKQRPLGLS